MMTTDFIYKKIKYAAIYHNLDWNETKIGDDGSAIHSATVSKETFRRDFFLLLNDSKRVKIGLAEFFFSLNRAEIKNIFFL